MILWVVVVGGAILVVGPVKETHSRTGQTQQGIFNNALPGQLSLPDVNT
jgi:hypothetical protein